MSRCFYVRARLSPYLDGELSERERRKVENHLETCPACRQELHLLQETIRLMADLPPVEPPQGIAQRVVGKVEGGAKKGLRLRSRFFPLVPKASSLIAALIILSCLSGVLFYLYYRGTEEEKGPGPLAAVITEEKEMPSITSRKKEAPKPMPEVKKEVKESKPAVPLREPVKGPVVEEHLKKDKLAEIGGKKEKETLVDAALGVGKEELTKAPIPLAIKGKVEAGRMAKREASFLFRLLPVGSSDEEGKIRVHSLNLAEKMEPGSKEAPIIIYDDPLLPILKAEPNDLELPRGKRYPEQVVLRLVVDPQGKVAKADVESGTGDESLDRLIVTAVCRWEFSPLKIGERGVYSSGRLSLKLIPAEDSSKAKEKKNES
jgi:TonB family protein